MTAKRKSHRRLTLAGAEARVAALEGILADLLAFMTSQRDKKREAARKAV